MLLSQSLLDAINNKTKPLASLRRLESLAAQFGLIQRSTAVRITVPAILVFAGTTVWWRKESRPRRRM